jgi:hypothetical protein
MAATSTPDLLVLHAIRIKGFTGTAAAAARFSLDLAVTEDLLLDYEAYGWVQRSSFADLDGWALTEAGRAENGRRLAAELDALGARAEVAAAHEQFVPLNARFLGAVTKWQIRPVPGDPMAANDHTDHRWDDRVFDSLGHLDRRLRPLGERLSGVLDRFGGYADRFSAALGRAVQGERSWVDQTGIDSCHTVWFELHEDLLATLGLERQAG